MTNFVLIPGAWMGAWVWEEVADGLGALGHHVSAITLSGLTKEADVSTVGLDTHVNDVLSHLAANDLREVVLVGHSYSGIVVGQVADRVPDRIAHTVFVHAFLPHDGKSLLEAFDEQQREEELRQIAEHQGRWPAPVLTDYDKDGLSTDQKRWLMERFVGHPGRTVSEPATMYRPLAQLHATYIECTLSDGVSDDVEMLRKEPTWTFRSIETGHWPMISTPKRLVELLDETFERHT